MKMEFAKNKLNSIETKENKTKKVFSIAYKIYHFVAKVFLYAILIILIMIAVLYTLYFIDMQKNIKSGENKQPLFGAYIIISPSMVPTINVEDAIIIQRKSANELNVGDIITFVSSDPRYSGLTVTHRIVGIEKTKKNEICYRTKGDNNNSEDLSLVSYKNVYGKVILRIPKIGYLQQILTTSYGWVLLVVIPCLGIVIYDILKLFKNIGKKKDTNKKLPNNNEEYIELIEVKNEKSDTDKDDIEII